MKTIISFTTLPNRISKIKPTINSLLNQTKQVDKIYLWLPNEIIRLNQKFKEIPDFLRIPEIEIVKVKDIGSITKIWYAIQEFNNTNVITIDDDVIYPKKFVESLINNQKSHSEVVLACRGRLLHKPYTIYNKSTLIQYKGLDLPKNVHVVTGTWGALYNTDMFDNTFFSKEGETRAYTDDIYISANMWRNNIPMKVIPKFEGNITPSDIHAVDSLWETNSGGLKNNKSIDFFKKDLLKYKYL